MTERSIRYNAPCALRIAKISTFAGHANGHGPTKTQTQNVVMNYVTIESTLIPFYQGVN
jgi:hypothetical protein